MDKIQSIDTPEQKLLMYIKVEQAKLLYRQAPFKIFGIFAIFTAIVIYFWHDVSHQITFIWGTGVVLITLIRAVIIFKMNQAAVMGKSIDLWNKMFFFTAIISGILWGSTVPLMMSSVENALFISLMLIGMVAGSLVPLSSHLSAFYAFSISALTILIYNIATTLLFDGVVLAVMFFIFLLVNLGYAAIVSRNLFETLQLRFENMALIDDLSEKHELIQAVSEDKTRFLASASHDLRQPLHALDLHLGILEAELSTDKQLEPLAKVKQSSKALGSLLKALLDVACLDAGEVKVKQQVFDLSVPMFEVVGEWQPQFKQAGRSLRCKLQHVFVESDHVLLKRLVRNLLVNSFKHTQGDVLMGMRKRGDVIHVEVWDQGDGLSLEEQEKIFSEFYQLRNPERNRNKGLGLGLSIVSKIASLLGLSVLLRSWEGKGSCFSVGIPLYDQDYIKEAHEKDDASIDVSGTFVLVVDDEPAIRDGMLSLLRSWDCEALVAASGHEAISELRQHHYPAPDVLILDYRLGDGGTGTQLAEEVCKLFDKSIPTLIVSGDMALKLDEGKHLQKWKLLQKPVAPLVLKLELAKLLRA